MRLAIGTAQFGLSYGVANNGSKVSENEVKKILTIARQSGIELIDTAISYGDSENVLGSAGIEGWKIITKLPKIPLNIIGLSDWMHNQIQESLNRLAISSIYGVLLHCPNQLLGYRGGEILDALKALKTNKLTKKIGISIYSPLELDNFDLGQSLDIVQTPLNLLDRSLIESGWIERLNQLKIEIHVRSVFLQGLLLMKSEERPQKFSKYSQLWLEWDRWLYANNLSPLQGCMSFINSIEGIDGVLVGVDSSQQLKEIIAASNLKLENIPNWSQLIDPNLINPSLWARL